MIWVLQVLFFAAFYLLAHWIGERKGRRLERARCESLLHQAILARGNSPSVRWVWNAVDSGSQKLMDKDEFFGPDKDEKK